MNPEERAAALEQARDLIAWLEAHPEVPVWKIEARFHADGDDDAQFAEIERISAAVGLPVEETINGHRIVRRGHDFAAVSYEAIAVPNERMAQHYAWASYSGSVEPESVVL